jgi:eukaryotic translation initiation factor 2C
VMNIDQATSVFYSPGPLMSLAMGALRARGPERVQRVSEQEGRALARAMRKVEVQPTHRDDRKRRICGVSAQAADETMVNIRGEEMSVAAYFCRRYGKVLQYPALPPVNVGGRRPGTETWLPIELCSVVPGQHYASAEDLDLPEITRLTSQPPPKRKEKIVEVVRRARFDADPFLAAFGVVVEPTLETVDARVVEAPFVQFANVSVHRSDGQWSLNNKRFVKGATVRNWGGARAG